MSDKPETEVEAAAPAAAAPARDLEKERDEFLAYVEKEVRPYAAELGFVVAVTNKPTPADEDFKGPTFRYDPATGEGRVFVRKADVPTGWIDGDELRARNSKA